MVPQVAGRASEEQRSYKGDKECNLIAAHKFSLADRHASQLLDPRQCGFMFGERLPVLLVEIKNVEKRGQQRLKILAARLISRESGAEGHHRLGNQTLAVDFQHLGSGVGRDVLIAHVEISLLDMAL